jgi:hypothetical protein
MLREHPFRVLGIVAAVAVGLLALSAPGADDTSGAWYYVSAFGWFGFLITMLTLIVLAVAATVMALGRRRGHTT